MKKIALAAAVLAIGAASYSLPAFALADDYGQFVYTDQSPSRFAPEGQASNSNAFRATIDFGSTADVAPRAPARDPFESIDRAHKAW